MSAFDPKRALGEDRFRLRTEIVKTSAVNTRRQLCDEDNYFVLL
jgi:hypothetical protein